eukprot:8440295-Ditylum_brightwellii.AAC.1
MLTRGTGNVVARSSTRMCGKVACAVCSALCRMYARCYSKNSLCAAKSAIVSSKADLYLL